MGPGEGGQSQGRMVVDSGEEPGCGPGARLAFRSLVQMSWPQHKTFSFPVPTFICLFKLRLGLALHWSSPCEPNFESSEISICSCIQRHEKGATS